MKKMIILGFLIVTALSYSKSKTDRMLILAHAKLRAPYVWGSMGPNKFDCSGFTYHLYKRYGASIPRTSKQQSKSGRKVAFNNLKKGDLVFFDTSRNGRVNHVGIYLGESKFIHASSSKGRHVKISRLNSGFYRKTFKWGVKNPLS